MMNDAQTLTSSLIGHFVEHHPHRAARAIEGRPPEQAAALLREQSPRAAAEMLSRLGPDDAALILAAADASSVVPWVETLDPARASTLLARLDEEQEQAIVQQLPTRLASELRELLEYPSGTAGSLMDARFTAFAPDSTVQHVLGRIRSIVGRRISDVMVADETGRLLGVVPLQSLIGASSEQRLEELLERKVIIARPMTRREEVVDLLNEHKLSSLPVVDLRERLIGVLRYDALVAAAQQDATLDMQQMVGASREERALSSPWLAMRTRLPWLHVNLVTAFLAASVVGLFEDTIAKLTAIAVLLPVVAGQSGNTGAQALAVTMRGLALREIRARQWWRVMRKEIVVGLLNGLAIALVTAFAVFVWSGNMPLSVVIAVAMVMSMVVASIAGASIPVVLVTLGRDPATASSIILTTVTDVVGFLTFLGLATVFSSLLVG